jgi:hypothetical protein
MELMTDKLKTDWHYAIYEHLATIGEGPVAPTPRIAVFQPPARGHAFLGELQHLEQQNKNSECWGNDRDG